MTKNLFILMISIIFTSGCVPKNAFRPHADSLCEITNEQRCIKQARTSAKSTSNKDYQLSFFEFDDQGFLHNRNNKATIINEYKSIANTQDILLMVFIHGWHHTANSNPEDSNVVDFRDVLSHASEHTDKKVLGVYIGWRGESVDVPVLDEINFINWATFWDRKNTAHEIGTQGLTSLMLELEEIVKPTTNSDHTMLSIGHSFGAAALFSAIKPVLAERLIRTRDDSNGVIGFGDLVLLLNPAFEGLKYASLFELSQNDCKSYVEQQKPRFISLSTSADFPVGWLFPTGRRLNTLAESYRSAPLTHCANGKAVAPSPLLDTKFTDRYAIGHNSLLLSHALEATAQNGTKRLFNANTMIDKRTWDLQSGQSSIRFGGFSLEHKKITDVHSPYMNITTDASVMDGHNDIWNEKIKFFIYQTLELINK
ncbi:hypothetical protein GMES_1195 [Paraglaciecola mesophila KMM 241]|uniref:Lipoprotein n=1 Tax=Paraglaciecola mesophila KMM 241 TaxID=1128912 RepID=K6XSA0_9ALTE|nr:hypothetical protein [Paraglaciecola mesophila]GAC23494.1 hypothetical protein GMES_1195 [Paraglaciecola mesophila KMM 241]